jgi:branched-chain amino acid transport system ATP-binding protein
MSQETLLAVDSIDVFYGGFQALREVSLEVRTGEIVALVGANGAGKSTLLNAVSGLIEPAKGMIRYKGEDIGGKDPSQIVSRGISHVPQGRRLFPDMTVLDNLTLGSYNRNARPKVPESLRTVYDLFPILERRKEQPAKTLSGGEQQMLALGRGLMSNPQLMLLDEMSLGLAPIIIGKVYRALREIRKRGITVLFVEQSVRRSLQEADRAYIIEAGRVVLQGNVSDLREEGEIKKAYFGI